MVKSLTEDQAKKLRDRRQLRPADRANLDYKMVKKLQAGLDGLAGLIYIMKALPPAKIRPKKDNNGRKIGLRDRHIRLMFELTESALRILDYKKIRGDADDPYVLKEISRKTTGINWQTGKPIKHGEFRRQKPKREEFERAKLLWDHVDYLKKYFLSEFNIENPSIVRYRSIEDRIDEQMWEKDNARIKELFKSGLGVEQIAREVSRDSWDVWQAVYQIQNNERKNEQHRQDIINLENDAVAIERIKTLSAKNVHPIAIAVDINRPIEAVRMVINKIAIEPHN